MVAASATLATNLVDCPAWVGELRLDPAATGEGDHDELKLSGRGRPRRE